VTPIPNPTGDKRPTYVFSSSESGSVDWQGSCDGYFNEDSGNVIPGNNSFSGTSDMPYDVYDDCTLQVDDLNGTTSQALTMSEFEIFYCADTALTGISQDECEVLIQFYDATG